MIPAVDQVQRRPGLEARDHRLQERELRERVAGPLQEQHRDRDPIEVLGATDAGLPRRMQREAEKDEAAYTGERRLGGRGRGHPAPERLAAREQRQTRRDSGRLSNGFPHTRGGHGGWVGPAPTFLHVQKLVAERGDLPERERLCQLLEKRVAHPRPGAVRQDEQRPCIVGRDEQVIHRSPFPHPPSPASYRILPSRSGGRSITVIFRSSLRLPSVKRRTYSPAGTRRNSSGDVGSPSPRGRGRSRFRSHVTRCTPGNPEPVRLRTVSPAAVVITSFTPSGCISRKEYVITEQRGGFDATKPKLPNPGCVCRSRYWYAGATSNRWIVSLSTESLNSSTGPTPTT